MGRNGHRRKFTEGLLDNERILASLDVQTGQTIVDAGCGNGYMAKEFAKLTGKTGKVFALDPDSISIEVLRSETEDTIIDPFVGDITEETKLATSSIDLIYVSTVIHGFSQPQMEGFLKEVKRLLKPNGRLAIVEIKKEDTPFGPPLDMRYSPEELRQTINLTSAGFKDVEQFFYMQIFNK